MRNLPEIDERIIEWTRPIVKGQWAMSIKTRARGIVTGYCTRNNRKYAKLVFTHFPGHNLKVERKRLIPVDHLVRITAPISVPFSNAWLWPDQQGHEYMNYCTKLQQWVLGPHVCERRRQASTLFPRCAGCDLTPLIDRDAVDPDKAKTRLIFSDPPAHPVHGSAVPADSWRSGSKVIGRRRTHGKGITRPIPTATRPVTTAPPKPKRATAKKTKDALTAADFIKDEVKK